MFVKGRLEQQLQDILVKSLPPDKVLIRSISGQLVSTLRCRVPSFDLNPVSALLQFAKCQDPIDNCAGLSDAITVTSWDQYGQHYGRISAGSCCWVYCCFCSIVDEMVGFTHLFRHLCQSGKVAVTVSAI